MKPKAVQDLPRSQSAVKATGVPSAKTGKQPAAKKRAASGPSKKQAPAKKLKVEDPQQRSIASFLASPSRAAAAATNAPGIKVEDHHSQARFTPLQLYPV